MKRLSFALGALALVAFLWPSWTGQRSLAVAATPTPVALQYDQIVRMVMPPATPPAPGSFQADYQAVMAAAAPQSPDQGSGASPSPAPHRGGLGGLLGQVMSGQMPSGEGGAPDVGGAMAAMNQMRAGTLTRLTHYKGWLRTEYPALQRATISKCDQHQFIQLDLARKTYTITNTSPACPPSMPMGPMGGPHPMGRPQNEAPGTADMTIDATQRNLGPLTIDTIPTTGYDNAMSMTTTNATGSCQNSSMGMNMLQYISRIPTPHEYCPLPRTPENPGDVMAMRTGGCKPTMHVHGSPTMGFNSSLLVMYSKMTMGGQGGEGRMAGFAMVTERGNVKWLSGAPADALFTIPPGFTQAQ